MKKIHRDILLRSIKLLNIVLAAVPFALCWHWFYASQTPALNFPAEHYLIALLLMVLYCIFGRIYEAFQISTKHITEMIYSQSLSALAADAVMFLVLWLLQMHLPRIWPMALCLLGQMVIFTIWSLCSNRLYFRVFPPEATAIIYDTEEGLTRLIGRYGLSKKYDIQATLQIRDCLTDLSVLEHMDLVFITGVHSHERNIVLKYCIAKDIHVLVAPRIGDLLMSSAVPSHLFHIPMFSVMRYAATPEYLLFKRLTDIVLSLLGLIVASPFMLVTALAIKAYDHGPIFYSHIRLTKDGKKFRIYKFRSMRTDAEKDGVARLSTGDHDDRITPVGRVIRKLRIDELPQLWNILKGDLSIVGPRPERPEIAALYCREMPEFALRLQAKAGLTGYAQVYGKYNTTPYDKLQMDLMYISHPSLVQDFKIIMATIKILFMPESTEGIEEGHTTAMK